MNKNITTTIVEQKNPHESSKIWHAKTIFLGYFEIAICGACCEPNFVPFS